MIVLSVLLLAAAVAISVVLVIRSAFKAHQLDDQDAPLDEHADTVRAWIADFLASIATWFLGRRSLRPVSARRPLPGTRPLR